MATTLGEGDSFAIGINNAGQIVGNLGYGHAVLWNGTIPTALETLGGPFSGAAGINDAGQVVGWSYTRNMGRHATLWNGTVPTDLGGGDDSMFSPGSEAISINNVGQVVGYSQTTPGGDVHAVLWNGTTLTDLNKYLDPISVSAGWVLTGAHGINDAGSIVGTARNLTTDYQQGFLLSVTAVPEPQTYALMLAGIGMVGFATRRRKPANA